MPKISEITCHKVLNSRATWTIETHVKLDDGSIGTQTIPEGASKGENEAIAIPVEKAIQIVSTTLNEALKDEDPFNQREIDEFMIKMDGTPNKSKLGGNSILSVSQAISKAAAISKQMELWEYLSFVYCGVAKKRSEIKYPTPVFNILNGGKHAHNSLSFQEFMVIPAREKTISEALDTGVNIYNNLKELLLSNNLDIDVGDEGGFAPNGLNPEKALSLIKEAASKSYEIGKDVFFGMDVAAGSFYKDGAYNISEENLNLDSGALQKYYEDLMKKFELIYIEDPFYEKDLSAWSKFNSEVGGKLMVVGDDLFVTNKHMLTDYAPKKLANAVIVKPNQIGTVIETFDFIKLAKELNMTTIVSHRSGDTAEDTFIADLAVAADIEFMKAGAPVRGERVAKYNRLLEILSDRS